MKRASVALSVLIPVVATLSLAQQPGTLWPYAREGHVMAFDALRGETILLGGDSDDSTQTRDSLWAWSGSAWRVAGNEPGWRTLPALAFDSKRGRMVLFGGRHKFAQRQYADTATTDTWEWDGARWQRMNVNTPGRVDHHAMAYDEARGVIVMQGGGDGADVRDGSTWTYDGTAWTRVADASSGPGTRVHHAMAYDSRRQRVVLFGGFAPNAPRSPDVWEWDGRQWTHIVVGSGPGARSRHRMAYDAARGIMLMYGGNQDRTTWGWNGTEWRQLAIDGPPARSMSAMAYDSKRERVVMYGGSGEMKRQLWEWDGTTWLDRTVR